MHKLIDYICDELEGIEKKAEKGELSMSEVQYADTLAHLKKNLLKSEEMMEHFDDEYSSEMRPMVAGSYRYDRGMSYARGGRNVRRDSMGRYSRDGEIEEAVESIRGVMSSLPQDVKHDAQKLVQKLEQHMM